MRYKLLGKSGLRVSELALGTMTFGEDWNIGTNKEESRRIYDAYIEAGGNFIDTATNYNEGTSEEWLGEFIEGDRDRLVIATKYTMQPSYPKDLNISGNQRKNMVRTLEKSLRRLKSDYVDVYWVHSRDFVTPMEEVMRGLDDLVRAGKVLYIGISDTPAWVVSQANTMAELRGWTPFVGLQIRYSLVDRSAERDLLPMARAFDLGVTPWGVLGTGMLTGKYNSENPPDRGRIARSDDARNKRSLRIADEVVKIARELGAKPSQVALAWTRQQPGVLIPLIGARTLGQMADNLGALDVELDEKQMQRLDDVSQIELGFPHDFLKRDNIKRSMFSAHFDEVDLHRGERW
jgi:aryl-alcohol dehydrogenase-like predicted oxidoreductase